MPGSVGPDEPCVDKSECFIGYTCAKGLSRITDDPILRADEQSKMDAIGTTCYLKSQCDTIQKVNGYDTYIECESIRDKSTSRRRLADISLKNLPAGCYSEVGDTEPIDPSKCKCHDDCKSCGFYGTDHTAAG